MPKISMIVSCAGSSANTAAGIIAKASNSDSRTDITCLLYTSTEYKDIGIDKLICAAGSQALQSFVSQKVGAITRYDEKNGTELLDLLRYYIENNGSISSIAQQLGVHRNTLNYQLGRIKELFALTLNETDRAELTQAFRILKLNEKGHLL